MRIHSADRLEAIATSQIASRCAFLGNRSQPNTHTAMNVDSRKNAAVASMASSEPKMSPT